MAASQFLQPEPWYGPDMTDNPVETPVSINEPPGSDVKPPEAPPEGRKKATEAAKPATAATDPDDLEEELEEEGYKTPPSKRKR